MYGNPAENVIGFIQPDAAGACGHVPANKISKKKFIFILKNIMGNIFKKNVLYVYLIMI